MLDVFTSDAFSMVSLTEAIAKLPYVPSYLGKKGLFAQKGITTTTAVLDEKDGVVSLIPTAARGSRPNAAARSDRNARSFVIPHIPLNEAVMADDVQNIRAFGSETTMQTVAGLVNERLGDMKQSFEATWEYHRVGAISGVILDADGTTEIYDLFDEFGLTEHEVEFDFSDATTDVKQLCTDVIRLIQDALGAAPYTGIEALCGDDFFDALTSHAKVVEAYERWQTGEFLRTQQNETGFPFGGVYWRNYRGSVGSVSYIDADTARFFPLGVPKLFAQYNAPANFVETVNTIGRPIYVKQRRMDFDTGVELHAQSNPLFMCTRPQCLIKGTRTTTSGTSGSA